MTADPAQWRAAATRHMPWHPALPAAIPAISAALQRYATASRNLATGRVEPQVRQLALMYSRVQHCSLSPDGNCLAYAWSDADNTAGVDIVQVDTGQQIVMQLEQDEQPFDLAWQASTGKLIVVLQTPRTYQICAFHPAMGNARLSCFDIDRDVGKAHCFWSENGSQLILHELISVTTNFPPSFRASCRLVDMDNQCVVLITDSPLTERTNQTNIADACWSRDGQTVAVVYGYDDTSIELFDCQSGQPVVVNGAPLLWQTDNYQIADERWICNFRCWLPEPKAFLVPSMQRPDNTSLPEMTDIGKLSMVDGVCQAMHWGFGGASFWFDTVVRSLSTSPDGRHAAILFHIDVEPSCDDEAYGYLFHLEAGFLMQLPVQCTIQHGCCWSPCSRWLAYCCDDRDEVVVLDVGKCKKAGDPVVQHHIPYGDGTKSASESFVLIFYPYRQLQWSPDGNKLFCSFLRSSQKLAREPLAYLAVSTVLDFSIDRFKCEKNYTYCP